MEKGGNMPAVLNAANEVAVQAFLEDKIGFLQMSDVVGNTMEKINFLKCPTYEDYIAYDKEARVLATQQF
jgi:1-deoxy-D-xylulose-5-phosphate reductoisomerase